MSIGYSGPLDRAWQRMRLILFSPFDLGKWIVLGFAAWLANLTGGMGGGGFRGNFKGDDLEELNHVLQSGSSCVSGFLDHWFWLPLLVLALVLLAAFVLLCVWLSSRGKFIFLDNVVHDRALIADPWRRYRELGNSLFLWRLGLAAVGLALFGTLFGAAVGLSYLLHGRLILSLGFVLPLAILAVVPILVLAYVSLYLENFVVPIMYGFGLKCTEAWKVFLEWWKRHPGPFIVYGLFVLGLSLLVGMAVLVVGFATCCIGFFILMLPYVGTVLTLPIWVTYRALGVEFLAQFDPRFDLFAAALATEAADGPTDGGPEHREETTADQHSTMDPGHPPVPGGE